METSTDMDDTGIRVLVVDDHTVVRDGLSYILQTAEQIQVVAMAPNGEMAVRYCRQYQPDVVLMDLVMPGMDGLATIRQIHKEYPQIRVIALTSFADENLVHQALEAGAISYLTKNVQAKDLISAIRDASRGQSVLAPEATQALVKAVTQPASVSPLTTREHEALAYMAEGLTNDQMAERMVISRNTVRHHVGNILAKLGAVNRTEAVGIAMQRNLVPKAKRA